MTSELERIKILESKISQVVDFIKKLTSENDRLKDQVKELKADRKEGEEAARKVVKFEETIKKYEEEREALKIRIEAIIKQIDQLGL
ncbi:MAG: cell division protein ZapB [Candidatus Aminicenantes bacterium]|nr:cell division protein ZapB [Candidatus Aminicenantes bacterium]